MLRLRRLAIMIWPFALCAAFAPEVARAECARDSFPIAVDIGHTEEDPGAMSARGIPEFAFNLALGRDTAAALARAGFPVHRIIVPGRGKTQLSRRVAASQALSPALVISIHHDSVQERYPKTWRFAGQSRRYSDRFAGHSIFVSRASPHFEQSLDFARTLGRGLAAAGLRHSAHHAENIPGENRETLDADLGVFEFRNLRVLREAAAPAILLEAGIIVNRAEEIALASPARRNLVAAAIVDAVTAMCAGHGSKLVLNE
jgi:N-acetylmuramoyl-L-alanine amidase